MDKKERFNKAYNYLIYKGLIRKQKDLSEKMNIFPQNISRAIKGEEKYLTDNFLVKFNRCYDDIFSLDWLKFGTGEMLAAPDNQSNKQQNVNVGDNNINNVNTTDKQLLNILEKEKDAFAELQKQLSKSQEQIDRLLTLLERSQTA